MTPSLSWEVSGYPPKVYEKLTLFCLNNLGFPRRCRFPTLAGGGGTTYLWAI